MQNHIFSFSVALLFCLATSPLSGVVNNYYADLGVSKSASLEEIKRAYKKLAVKNHPDRNNPKVVGEQAAAEAIANFKKAAEAYEVLSDTEKREKYDRYGTVEKRSSRNSEESLEQVRAKSFEVADKRGKEDSNSHWRYEPETRRFYDNRVRKWLHWNALKNSFYSEEGWLFHSKEGTYQSVELGIEWNPADKRGWYRKVENASDRYVPVDPKTGFPLSAPYLPSTVSDASDLFDELFNPRDIPAVKNATALNDTLQEYFDPIGWANQKQRASRRAELVKKVAALPWTETQRADYVARAKEHVRILTHPDMFTDFSGPYQDLLVEAILDHPQSLGNPEIAEFLISKVEAPRLASLVNNLILREDWWNHLNASRWVQALFSTETGGGRFIQGIFTAEANPAEAVKRFEKFYPLLLKVGMNRNTAEEFLRHIGRKEYGTAGFEAFKEKFDSFVKHPSFMELIANLDSKQTKYVEPFLDWYKDHEPGSAQALRRALSIPGVSQMDFYRINASHTQYSFHEREYMDARRRVAKERLQYLQHNLPGFQEACLAGLKQAGRE